MSIANKPAFPCGDQQGRCGITKREYFAAQAMVGILSSGDSSNISDSQLAEWAAHTADALIEELGEGSK